MGACAVDVNTGPLAHVCGLGCACMGTAVGGTGGGGGVGGEWLGAGDLVINVQTKSR